jgi:hypothetical protein
VERLPGEQIELLLGLEAGRPGRRLARGEDRLEHGEGLRVGFELGRPALEGVARFPPLSRRRLFDDRIDPPVELGRDTHRHRVEKGRVEVAAHEDVDRTRGGEAHTPGLRARREIRDEPRRNQEQCTEHRPRSSASHALPVPGLHGRAFAPSVRARSDWRCRS